MEHPSRTGPAAGSISRPEPKNHCHYGRIRIPRDHRSGFVIAGDCTSGPNQNHHSNPGEPLRYEGALRRPDHSCTIANMPQHFEADVLLLHIAAGAARSTPPPGSLAQTAPRRAARGRGDDLTFITLDLRSASTVSPGHTDQLARLAVEAFYGPPGSVTAALRGEAAA